MKILMYGWEFPPRISGGLGVACEGIVYGLLENHIKVNLVLPHVPMHSFYNENLAMVSCGPVELDVEQIGLLKDTFKKFLKIKSIDTLLVPYINHNSYQEILATKKKKLSKEDVAKIIDFGEIHDEYGENLFSEVLRYAFIAGLQAAKIEHDIIHAHDWLTILAGIEAKKISQKPLIFHVHALETDRNTKHMNPIIFEIERQGMQAADKIIAVSHYTKKAIVEFYQIPEEKIAVAYNGVFKYQIENKCVDIENFDSDRNIVLFLGRLTSQKGPFYFIEAAKKVLMHYPNSEFVIAGDGDLLTDMIKRVAQLCIGSQVHFTRFLNKKQIVELFHLAKVYVMSSVSEPFGLTCLEAVSCNVPVIISKQSGVAEVIKNSIQVDFWDTEKMASAIISTLKYPALRRELVKNSQEEIKDLHWGNTTKKIIEVYKGFKEI